jgi:preprotein translocase subunit YajC
MHQFQRKDTPVLGNMILAASSKPSSSSSTFLLILVVLVAVFYFVMIRPQSRRRRQVMEQQRQIQPGQRVRTTAGMYGTVVSVEDNDVVLEVAPGVQVRYLKRAIMEVLPDETMGGMTQPDFGTEQGTEFAEPHDEFAEPEAHDDDTATAEDEGQEPESVAKETGSV